MLAVLRTHTGLIRVTCCRPMHEASFCPGIVSTRDAVGGNPEVQLRLVSPLLQSVGCWPTTMKPEAR